MASFFVVAFSFRFEPLIYLRSARLEEDDLDPGLFIRSRLL